MKRLIFAGLFVAVAAFSANAQKGSVLLYGNVNATAANEGGDKAFSITPGIGYQLNNNWTIGGELGLSAAKEETPSFKVGPFVRRTWTISNVFSIYSQLGAGYVKNGTTSFSATEAAINQGGTKGFYASLSGPVVSMNIKNGFALNLGVGDLTFTNTKNAADVKQSKFDLNFGSGLTFGISKNFGGKK